MSDRECVKLIREGPFVAEVPVRLTDSPPGWEPYLYVEDAQKLDRVRAALKAGDVKTAESLATVYRLTPVSAS